MLTDVLPHHEIASNELIGMEITTAITEAFRRTSRRAPRVRYHLQSVKVRAQSNGSGVLLITFTEPGRTAVHRWQVEIEPQAFRTIREKFTLSRVDGQK